jgi:hypothetical protein
VIPVAKDPSRKMGRVTGALLAGTKNPITVEARRIPESVIRQKLSEIKQGRVHSPAKVFTSAMKAYATAVLQKQEMSSLMSPRKGLFRI